MAVEDRRVPMALLAITLAWSVALALLGAQDALLYLTPALLLAAPLAVRAYPGERALTALAAGVPEVRPAAPRVLARPGRRREPAPRGALLIARSLAKRPPPASGIAS